MGREGGGGSPAEGSTPIERREEEGERLRPKFRAREADTGRGRRQAALGARRAAREARGARSGLPESRYPAGREGKTEITKNQAKT